MAEPVDLDALQALHETAQARGWYASGTLTETALAKNADAQHFVDSFTRTAVDAFPALIAEVRQLREENDQLKIVLDRYMSPISMGVSDVSFASDAEPAAYTFTYRGHPLLEVNPKPEDEDK